MCQGRTGSSLPHQRPFPRLQDIAVLQGTLCISCSPKPFPSAPLRLEEYEDPPQNLQDALESACLRPFQTLVKRRAQSRLDAGRREFTWVLRPRGVGVPRPKCLLTTKQQQQREKVQPPCWGLHGQLRCTRLAATRRGKRLGAGLGRGLGEPQPSHAPTPPLTLAVA